MTLLEGRIAGEMFTSPYKGGNDILDGILGGTSPQASTQQETLSESDFFMFCFKAKQEWQCCMQIQPCPIKSTHPWERCCYAHPHENARRRDPRQYRYIAEPCPDYKRGICLLGVQCPYAHGVYERNLHPSKYRTQLCTEGSHCTRHVCFFAHSPFQLRAPTHLWTVEEAEYVRQVLLEKIIRESEQAALREQAASLLAASRPAAARGFSAPAQQPASAMKAFHQQHLQNQMLQGLAKQSSSQQAEGGDLATQSNMPSPFAQMQVGSPPSALQVPATPPGVIPAPLRNTSNSPVRQNSPDSRRRAAGISLRQALSQPTPSRDDTLAEAALSAQVALHGTGGLPALGASPLRMHRGSRALTEDAEGPRMSMAMRRQLGIAPAKSPSKASSAAALLSAGGNPLRPHGSPVMSPSQSATLPFPSAAGMLAQPGEASQGLLLQQAALALQMQGASTLFGAEQPPDASTQALHAALRQQHFGTSTASEVSQPTDEYADLVARLQGMCFGLLGDPLAMPMEGGSTEEEQRTTSTGSVSQFESAGSAHAFDLDLGPLTSQPRVPHAAGQAFSAPPGPTTQDPSRSSHSFFSY